MTLQDIIKKPMPSNLPKTTADFLAQRKIKSERTLNDHVEDLHLQLYETKDYKRLLYAVYDEQAVEGSLAADNVLAAKLIRDKAISLDNPIIKEEKLATIAKALGVVLRRYGESRKDRRNMVGGETVAGDNGD